VKTRDMTLIALFAVLMIIGGKISLTVAAVTFSLQSLVCLLAGLLLGVRRAMLSQIIYILLGLIGLPVFARGGGIGYIFEPTFGFIPGMLLAAGLIGLISDKIDPGRQKLKIWQAITINITGTVVIYAVGITYLYLIKNFYAGQAMTFVRAVQIGLIPYLIFDFLKCMLAGVTGPRLRRLTSQFSSFKPAAKPAE